MTHVTPVEWTSGWVEGNEVDIHYMKSAMRSRTIVLLHGVTDSAECYQRVGESLAHAYGVVLMDARGHGMSSRGGGDFSYEAHAADLSMLIQHLELGAPVLMGHSMGAHVIAMVAAVHPEEVSALILEDPPWSSSVQSERSSGYAAVVEYFRGLGLDDVMEEGRVLNPHWDEADLRAWARSKLQVQLEAAMGLQAPQWRQVASHIRCPALLVGGDVSKGAMVDTGTTSVLAAMGIDLTIHRIPGAGHNIHRDRFTQFVDCVRGFLESSA